MRPVVIIQSTVGRLGVPVVAAIATGVLALETLSGGPVALLRALPWLGLVVLLAWLMWASARVTLEAEHLVLDNPFSKVRIGWAAVRGAHSQWGLVVEAADGAHKAWAAPSRGSASFGRRRVEPLHELQPTTAGAAAVRMDLDARAAALLIGEEAALRAPRASDAVIRTLHGIRIALLLGLTLLVLLSVLS